MCEIKNLFTTYPRKRNTGKNFSLILETKFGNSSKISINMNSESYQDSFCRGRFSVWGSQLRMCGDPGGFNSCYHRTAFRHALSPCSLLLPQTPAELFIQAQGSWGLVCWSSWRWSPPHCIPCCASQHRLSAYAFHRVLHGIQYSRMNFLFIY